MKVYIIRHGQTEANKARLFAGSMDSPLTNLGIEQAKEAGKKLENIEFNAIYASDLSRAIDTANFIRQANKTGAAELEVCIEPRLREKDFGNWEGLPFEEIEKKYADEWAKFISDPDMGIASGETSEAFSGRVEKSYNEIVGRHENASDKNICIVAHGGVLMALFSYFFYGDSSGYFKFSFSNAKINMVEYVGGQLIIKAINA